MGLLGVLSRTLEARGYKLSMDPILMEDWDEVPSNEAAMNRVQVQDKITTRCYEALYCLADEARPNCQVQSGASPRDDLGKLLNGVDFDLAVFAHGSGQAPNSTYKARNAPSAIASDNSYALNFRIRIVNAKSGLLFTPELGPRPTTS